MKIPFILLVVAILVAGCETITTTTTTSPKPNKGSSSVASHITFTVTCSDPAVRFVGTITEDRKTREVLGTGQGTFEVAGFEIVATFKKLGGPGEISLVGREGGSKVGNSSSGQPFGSVRADFHRTPTVLILFTGY